MRSRPLRATLAGILLGVGLLVVGIAGLPSLLDADPAADDRQGARATPVVDGTARAPATEPPAAATTPPEPTPQPEPEPTPEPEPEPTPEPVPVRVDKPALQARLAALLEEPRLAGSDVSLHVVDEAGREVFDHRADAPLLPASTAKLVTAAAALAEFGPAHRFTTTVFATVEPDAGGTVHGDLVVVGGLDPALATPAFAQNVNSQRPRTPLEALAAELHRAGVRRVTGRILGDPSALPHEPVAAGWLDRYLARGDAMRSSGLTVDGGRRLFETNGVLQSAPADDPAAEAAAGLTLLLTELEVPVAGEPGSTLQAPAAPHLLATVQSPPLVDLLAYTVQRSDNHLADTIFRALGLARGDGSWSGSARAVQDILAPLELDWDAAVLADGSGLSRDDRLSARFLTSLDLRMQASNRAEEWRQVMAVSGRSGTLRARLRGTVAEGRLLGKTGTLNDTRSLSGTVEGPDGTRYHFAVIANDLGGDATGAARELQDHVALALAGDLYDCQWVPVSASSSEAPVEEGDREDGQDGEEPPTVLRCAA